MEDRRNERFGRYEILTELGRGAMGIVYKARDPKINRVVAVKTVSLASQPPEEELEYRERFVREAEAAGRLSHPGIVTIFDVGEEPETRAPYIVMEFVAGQSLDKALLAREDRKLPPEEALQIALELAEALDCAHGQGVVHRDLKPANILVAEDGHVKIADFGIAKMNRDSATSTGRTLGTPAYMSPEQLNDEQVDGRSDIFSLGVILYTVLTGYRPFQGNSAMTVAYKVVNREPIPATVLDTELPPGLDYIIGRAIAKDPSQRYQRGMEMVLDIQELQQGREPWSKAKHSDSPVGLAETTNHRGRLIPLGANTRRPTQGAATPEQSAAAGLLEKMRQQSFAGALLLVGILVFALRMGHLPGTRSTQPKNLDVPKQMTVSPPSAVAPANSGAEPIVKKFAHKMRKPVSIRGAESPTTLSGLRTAAAMLEIEVDHKFEQAHISIWVDDQLTYTHPLEGIDKKRLVVFHHFQGHEFHAVQIPSGSHLLRVQVAAIDGKTPDQSATVAGDFPSGAEKMLRVQVSKSGELTLSLQ